MNFASENIRMEEALKDKLFSLDKPALISIILQQGEEIAVLRAKIDALEGRLNKDSHNSSIPPSKGFKGKVKNLRESSGKPQGGQAGHKGETLKFSNHPTRTVTHKVSKCTSCGMDLSDAPTKKQNMKD